MTSRRDWTAELRGRNASAWPGYLAEHSGLPGPRANLELVAAVAALADARTIETLMSTGDEYHAMCAAAAAGHGSDLAANEATARDLAADERWRVREGVAIGLQLLGDTALLSLLPVVRAWVEDPDPLVVRAAVAAICEPRLLRDPAGASAALELCERATARLVAMPPEQRRAPGARTLRQALGYCWSVAVAADPDAGLEVFGMLDVRDPDVAWIVDQNRGKRRLARLL